jgi:excisionase family DNA binding protein
MSRRAPPSSPQTASTSGNASGNASGKAPGAEPATEIDAAAPLFLTTREVAELLRVRERKVYDLAAEGGIPHRRITGKLLFPRAALMAWAAGEGAEARPNVVTGSHDPLLDWALGASEAGMARLWNGSRPGLEAFGRGEAALAALHLAHGDDWNIGPVAELGPREAVLLHWARRQRGLLLAPGGAARIAGLADLRGARMVARQPGAGATLLLARLCAEAGLPLSEIEAVDTVAHTEAEAAGMVARGEADAALGIAAMARSYSLDFVALLHERVDLLVCRRQAFDAPLQRLLAFARSPALAERATALGGYDLSETGTVRWLGP